MYANSSSDQNYRRSRRHNNSYYNGHENYGNYNNESVNYSSYYPNGQWLPSQQFQQFNGPYVRQYDYEQNNYQQNNYQQNSYPQNSYPQTYPQNNYPQTNYLNGSQNIETTAQSSHSRDNQRPNYRKNNSYRNGGNNHRSDRNVDRNDRSNRNDRSGRNDRNDRRDRNERSVRSVDQNIGRNVDRNIDRNIDESEPSTSSQVNEQLESGTSSVKANTSTSHSTNTANTNSYDKKDKLFHKKESSDDKVNKTYSDSRGYDRNNDKSYGRKYYNKQEDRKDRKDRNNSSDKPKLMRDLECDESQREIMDELLRKGEYECMVCCEEVKIRDSVWNCEHCYNIFHLKCIKMWANSESSTAPESGTSGTSWRCPACQGGHKKMPSRYVCFCGKVRDPELNRYIVPHSCGEMCGRKRKANQQRKHECPHKCMLLCHPGPCPPCQAKITRQCACGQTKILVSCATNDDEVICKNVCNKVLNCGQHKCESICHSGKCGECELIKTQVCYCGKNKREVKCSADTSFVEMYSCNDKCDRTLNCGHHKCDNICHPGDCNTCSLDPSLVTHCPCGKTELISLTKTKRKTCTDPIGTCGEICDKELVCGPQKEHHRCKKVCHTGPCPPCDQKTVIRCRCGANSLNIECCQLVKEENGEINSFVCKKRCNKKRQCGRHKCLNECCIDVEHKCEQICGKKLSCGNHTCQELCHHSNCPQCWNISWDELTCRCGGASILPPIQCGMNRPECGLICSRRHACDHPVAHSCHDDDQCPPCTYLVSKLCYGGHETRTVPCYEEGASCGYPCLKPLSCGLHRCQMICHSNDCGECTLPCNKIREDCQHVCGLKCHQNTSIDCPKSNCKVPLKVSCDCGRKTDQMACFKVNDEHSFRVSVNALANVRIKRGESVDITELMKSVKDMKLSQLKCDEKCAVMERNRQLAEALDIKDADFSPNPGPPNYSDMLKNAARSDPTFVADVFDKLTKLVIESKQSKLNFKNLNFPPMNSDNRHIIHELAEFFGCKTHAVDREPNRSVVVKAAKDKCYLPTVNLMDIVKDESDSRKTAPNKSNKITLKSYSFDQQDNDNSGPNIGPKTSVSIVRNDSVVDSQQNQDVIDYFDFNGD